MAAGSPKKKSPLVLLDLGYAKMTDCDRRPPAGFAVLWCLFFLCYNRTEPNHSRLFIFVQFWLRLVLFLPCFALFQLSEVSKIHL